MHPGLSRADQQHKADEIMPPTMYIVGLVSQATVIVKPILFHKLYNIICCLKCQAFLPHQSSRQFQEQLSDNSITNHISGDFSEFVRCRNFIFPDQG